MAQTRPMRRMLKCWRLLFLLLTLGLCSSQVVARVTLEVNAVDWPPFFMDQKQTGQVGFARELLQVCIQQTGFEIRYMHLPIKRTHQYMQSGELDLAIYSYKPERDDFVWYSAKPMFESAIGVAARQDFIQPLLQEADLEPWRIGYLAGLGLTPTLAILLAGKKRKAQAVEDYSMQSLFDQLIASPARIDLVINSKEALLWFSQKTPYQGKVKVLDFALAPKAYFLTVSKFSKRIQNPQQFLQQFDACLGQIQQNGQYGNLLKSYQLSAP